MDMKKKFLAILSACSLTMSLALPAYAAPTRTSTSQVTQNVQKNLQNDQLIAAYELVCEAYSSSNVEVSISLDEFIAQYDASVYGTPRQYANAYLEIMAPHTTTYSKARSSSSSSSSGSTWYYNTGTSLPQKANYSAYQLLSKVKKGDIVHEANGGFGITGHSAIVEGIFYNTTYKQYYVRIIEAISDGVCRSVLDDTRVDDKDVTIYRVSSATSTQINKAVSFATGELGSSYNLDFAKDTSSSEKDWYCSELVWAAYKNQGIDIETSLGEPGVTPRDIGPYSDATTKISIK